MEVIKNIKKFLSLRSSNASKPKMSFSFLDFLFEKLGGVLGRKKLKIPKAKEAMAAILNVFFNKPSFMDICESHPKK